MSDITPMCICGKVHEPMDEQLFQIYNDATRIAMRNNQVVGEKNDYYVTIAQLEDIILTNQGVLGN